MKVCTHCLRRLDFTCFHIRRASKDGLSPKCKDCARVANKRYRTENPADPEKGKARAMKWRSLNPEKSTEQRIRWRADNAERTVYLSARWYRENAEKVKARGAEWRRTHPDEVRERGARYVLENADEHHARSAAYRARILDAFVGPIPVDIKARLIELYGPSCMKPGCENTDLQIDHVVPLTKGGAHAVFNFQLLCRSCNCSKGNRSSADYRPAIEREECVSETAIRI